MVAHRAHDRGKCKQGQVPGQGQNQGQGQKQRRLRTAHETRDASATHDSGYPLNAANRRAPLGVTAEIMFTENAPPWPARNNPCWAPAPGLSVRHRQVPHRRKTLPGGRDVGSPGKGSGAACGGNPARERAGRAGRHPLSSLLSWPGARPGTSAEGVRPRPGGAFLRPRFWSHCPRLLAGCRHS